MGDVLPHAISRARLEAVEKGLDVAPALRFAVVGGDRQRPPGRRDRRVSVALVGEELGPLELDDEPRTLEPLPLQMVTLEPFEGPPGLPARRRRVTQHEPWISQHRRRGGRCLARCDPGVGGRDVQIGGEDAPSEAGVERTPSAVLVRSPSACSSSAMRRISSTLPRTAWANPIALCDLRTTCRSSSIAWSNSGSGVPDSTTSAIRPAKKSTHSFQAMACAWTLALWCSRP